MIFFMKNLVEGQIRLLSTPNDSSVETVLDEEILDSQRDSLVSGISIRDDS
jgi:hypothetical protein